MNIVKYPGGKEREIDIIQSYLPLKINNYYEPFVGGGAVYLSMDADHYYINDFSKDLMNLYDCVAKQDEEFFASMNEINTLWKSIDAYDHSGIFELYIKFRDGEITDKQLMNLLNDYVKTHSAELLSFILPMNCGNTDNFLTDLKKDTYKKLLRMKELNFSKKVISNEDIHENIVGVLKAGFYMYIRSLYDHMGHYTNGFKAMLYLFIRDFCYSSMFRFNATGGFNVPYGGMSYNRKYYDKVIEKYKSDVIMKRMRKTTFGCMDYLEFLKLYPPKQDDFMFVDPPYDSFFSTYDQKEFDAKCQKRLANYLINECACNFMLDIKYTDFIASLYKEGQMCKNGNPLYIASFDKKYSVSFMNRNLRNASHILVMNYRSTLC